MTQRIELLVKSNLTQRIEPSVLHNPKNWIFLTQRIEPFLSDRTQRIEPFLFESKTWELAFVEHDSMIWASFLHDSKNWTFSGIWLNGLNTFVRAQVTQSTEPFLECVSDNWAFFLNVTRRINLLFTWLKEFNNFFSILLKELSPSFQYDSKNCIFFSMTERIVFLRLKEYNFFFNMTRRIQLFDSKIWTLLK